MLAEPLNSNMLMRKIIIDKFKGSQNAFKSEVLEPICNACRDVAYVVMTTTCLHSPTVQTNIVTQIQCIERHELYEIS